ncbi:MAG TPA: AAA family ATPase, partial [Armatimonadota bacterium]|nr:AAA family ATPase [Armatimonadota bacterium]
CGTCNAQSGIGDPYLPFREILQMLTGDVEPRRAGGEITRDHARRLWALLPDAAPVLVEAGPDLIGRLLPGPALVARVEAFAERPATAPWRAQLAALARLHAAPDAPAAAGVAQAALFEQLTDVLRALARRYPLLLLLDDLQWADAGSLSLLFHLGRRLSGSRILVVSAYRPGEVALGRQGERHPLEMVVNELGREWGETAVDLDQAEGRAFVDALLDSEPNRLDEAFRATLARHTGGNALFTVELLRSLQEHGDLERDEVGRWVAGRSLNWGRIPPRVEAVIAERIARLPPAWHAALVAASVEGETFTAEVVARALDAGEGEVVRLLSGPLSKQHRLVRPLRLERLGARRLSRYRFRHDLFQRYLYRQLDGVERARLHEAVGTALEALYGEDAAEMVVLLAHHFRAAGLAAKTVAYLCRAGERAVRLSASVEACAHFQSGLALLHALPPSLARNRQELALQLGLSTALIATRGWAAPERAGALARAYELCQGTEGVETAQRVQTLYSLAVLSQARGEFQAVLDWGQPFTASQNSLLPVITWNGCSRAMIPGATARWGCSFP